MVNFIILICIIAGTYCIYKYSKNNLINPAAKPIINIIAFYIGALYVLFELDNYNVPTQFLKLNVDYASWLGYFISILSVLCFNIGFAIYLPEFSRVSAKNKTLVEDKKYHINALINNYSKEKIYYYFNLNVFLNDKRKYFKIINVYCGIKRKENLNILNKKTKNASIPIKTSILNREPEITLEIAYNNIKYRVTFATKK